MNAPISHAAPWDAGWQRGGPGGRSAPWTEERTWLTRRRRGSPCAALPVGLTDKTCLNRNSRAVWGFRCHTNPPKRPEFAKHFITM